MSALRKMIAVARDSDFPIDLVLEASHEVIAVSAALDIMVMFLTNVNTITDEKQAELVEALKLAGRYDLADAIAIRGFASA